MKSSDAYRNIVCDVYDRYGAPMGRRSDPYWRKPTDKKIYDRKVPLNMGGYDRGGAYWGSGDELRVEYTADLEYVRFYRKNSK